VITRHLVVIPLVLATAAGFWLPHVASAAQASAPRQSAPRQEVPRQTALRAVPSWVARPPAEDEKDLWFVGAATSASQSQARSDAFEDAVSKAVARIAARLFEDPSVTTWYGIDALREYARKVGRSQSEHLGPASSGGYSAYSLLQLNRGFIEPSLVRQYAVQPTAGDRQASTAVAFLLIPSDIGTLSTTKRTQVRLPNLREGNFYLSFSMSGTKERLSLRLDQIQVLEDGGGRNAPWSFEVFVNGARAFTTPVRLYDDDVITYRMAPGDRSVEAQITSPAPLNEIRIVGAKITAASAR
jgi:hypothetical protein